MSPEKAATFTGKELQIDRRQIELALLLLRRLDNIRSSDGSPTKRDANARDTFNNGYIIEAERQRDAGEQTDGEVLLGYGMLLGVLNDWEQRKEIIDWLKEKQMLIDGEGAKKFKKLLDVLHPRKQPQSGTIDSDALIERLQDVREYVDIQSEEANTSERGTYLLTLGAAFSGSTNEATRNLMYNLILQGEFIRPDEV